MEKYNAYPGIIHRAKAVITDTVVLIFLMMFISYTFSLFETINGTVKMVVFISVVFLYDPILTSLFGATIGHRVNGIKVKRASNQEKNLLFPIALVRYLLKFFLGLISLLTIGGNKEKRAIHDLAVDSIVLFR
ncbi:MAG: putative RDD family membrane protein YckC [Luteibaculaceae bacterium]|jgi:uncharacterized RDD family membrane protein YckC